MLCVIRIENNAIVQLDLSESSCESKNKSRDETNGKYWGETRNDSSNVFLGDFSWNFAVDKSPLLFDKSVVDSDNLISVEFSVNNAQSPVFEQAVVELKEYFSGTRRSFDLPLSVHSTPFEQRVWSQLHKIPFGQTATYGEIARSIGNPHAAEAVGNACRHNPVLIIIPCHRVIGANNRLTGYRAGLEIKRRLLALEAEKTR